MPDENGFMFNWSKYTSLSNKNSPCQIRFVGFEPFDPCQI